MTLKRLDKALADELKDLKEEGRAKNPERVITEYIGPEGEWGPRYKLAGEDGRFIRMNSNSYLSLSNNREVMSAADRATRDFGVGPGAVRFIDGTFAHHIALENRIAGFTTKPAAKIFNSAYTANCGLALAVANKRTHWIGDQLNHNSIIRAMRIAGVPSENKGIYQHNNLEDLKRCLDQVGRGIERIIVIYDGIFSMRGDNAPIDEIDEVVAPYREQFKDGVITVVDDSHGLGAYGKTGRGTPEHCNASPDIMVGTFGKAFGVNGGFIAASEQVVEAVRQKADTYIYTNPLSVADCAAAVKALDICDSAAGKELLRGLKERTSQFRKGLDALDKESIAGPHPVVPLLVRDTAKTHGLVAALFRKKILVVGLTFPVVPRGDELLRFQINAAHTESDIGYVLEVLKEIS